MTDDIQLLREMLAQHEARLNQNRDFLAWKALSNAIALMNKGDGGRSRAQRGGGPKVTQADGAIAILEERGRPLRTPDLLELLPERGVEVTGANPVVNLSSALSRDSRLVSVTWGGSKSWWLAGRDLPKDQPDIFTGSIFG